MDSLVAPIGMQLVALNAMFHINNMGISFPLKR